uniref:Uncharacterized protein n=1 Tax=Heterorhabditis bacteriophora TaxID=37862 RepID=A0A1I7WYZ8_HETBA
MLENSPRPPRKRRTTERIDGIIRRQCEHNLLPYVRSQSLGQNGIFQQDNNSKHSMAVPESSLESHRTPMERCREGGIETKAIQYKALEAVIKKDWAQISVQRCANLMDSMPRRCAAVIKNFEYPTNVLKAMLEGALSIWPPLKMGRFEIKLIFSESNSGINKINRY